jgi:voltage-gated potassium channel
MSVYNFIVAIFSIFSIVLLTISMFLDPESEFCKLLHYYDFALCGFFLYDFISRLKNSTDRKKYFFTIGWIDLISSIPLIHELRFGTVFRVFRIIRILKSIKLLYSFLKSNRKDSIYGGIIISISLIIVTTSSLVLYIEKDVGNIKTAEDALWWTYVTITTVGYGDYYPVTNLGKLVASILIVSGIISFGAVLTYLNQKINTIKKAKDQ